MTSRFLSTAALALALAACGGEIAAPQRDTAAEQARTVRVAIVEARPMDIGVTASGLLVPREEAAVGSELAGYRVAQVFAEEGNAVGRGTVLARLDPALLEGEIARARSQIAEAEARLARASAEARRGRCGRGRPPALRRPARSGCRGRCGTAGRRLSRRSNRARSSAR